MNEWLDSLKMVAFSEMVNMGDHKLVGERLDHNSYLPTELLLFCMEFMRRDIEIDSNFVQGES